MTENKLTEEQLKIRHTVFAYVCSGNSLWDLVESHIGGDWEGHYKDIVQELTEARKQDPECFESTVEEELESLEASGRAEQYSYNSPVLG